MGRHEATGNWSPGAEIAILRAIVDWRFAVRLVLIAAATAALVTPWLSAQSIGPAWQALGPGPSNNGQVEGIVDRKVVGAVNAIAAHPSSADILFVGGVNGGIWRSNNATSADPTWTRQTDTLRSQSIGCIEFDPTDASNQTLVAGIARSSSLGRRGGALIGALRTVDGGANWTLLSNNLANRAVQGIAARGAVIVAATDGGVFRSSDSGANFTQISATAGTGLPAGNSIDLASVPSNNAQLFVAVISGTRGIYRSDDTGATWIKVSDAAVDGQMATSVRTELSVGAANNVFAAIVGANRLANVAYSNDLGATWSLLGVPTTTEENGAIQGAHPGGQGSIHLSIAADRTDPNIVYIGGDRQPAFGEATNNFTFPNSLGARDYSGRIFKGNASTVPAVWSAMTHSGTAGNSAPHADSRDMAMDANGNLLESDDGGIYRRSAPTAATGNWFSVNGTLQTTEYHAIAYDSVANIVIGGAQDNGTSEQLTSPLFRGVSTADGGDVAVDDISSATTSQRYSSFQNLQVFRKRAVDAANVVQSTAFPALTPIGGSPAIGAQFYSSVVVNSENGARLLIAGTNGLYESLDQGNTVNRISTTVVVPQILGSPIVYGRPGNAEFILATVTNQIFQRTTAGGALTVVGTAGATTLVDLAIDPADSNRVFTANSTDVLLSTDAGVSFNSITGNLTGLDGGTLRSMAFVPDTALDDAIVVGTDRGVFVAFAPNFNQWRKLGTGMANVSVMELDYDAPDNVLVAGTLGRGAWRIAMQFNADLVFRSGFEDE